MSTRRNYILAAAILLSSVVVVCADIPNSLRVKKYEVDFGEWVDIWVYTYIHETHSDYYVLSFRKMDEDGTVRYVISGKYGKNRDLAAFFRDRKWPAIRSRIESQCKLWRVQGYNIPDSTFTYSLESF